MKEYKGLVLGGPQDGKVLSHSAPYYRAIILRQLSAAAIFLDPPTETEAMAGVSFGYVHVDFFRRGFWVPAEARKGRFVYDFIMYEDEADFIFRRLAANYRPRVELP